MFDDKLLDRMSFDDLNKSLHDVLKRIDKLERERPDGENDPRIDRLYLNANNIITRMDAMIREPGRFSAETIAKWDKSMKGYAEGFQNYMEATLEEEAALAREAELAAQIAAHRERLATLLDEKSLDGMNAGDLALMIRLINEQVEKIDKNFSEETAEPLITQLQDFQEIVIQRLDPLLREAYANKPDKLAEWEDIMREHDDIQAEREEPTKGEGDAHTGTDEVTL
ncbi:MAG TPA: hypothetical protein VNZ44_07855 [Pyrinomonadaceae bacterium]|nr:hypothetical protein [Pyrinomonadaceae bacterium]